MEVELAFVTTEEIVEELMKRFDSGGFFGIRDGAESDDVCMSWKGNPYMVSGMASDLSQKCLDYSGDIPYGEDQE